MVQYQDSVLQLYNPTPYPPPVMHWTAVRVEPVKNATSIITKRIS
jgi:hypothetical protein